jgi:EpsG family
MWPYWAMFLVPSLAAFLASYSEGGAAVSLRPAGRAFAWVPVWLLITLLVGYRFQVGGDWSNYFRYLVDVNGLDLVEVLTKEDPAYQLLNWLSVEMDWGIFGVNLIGGTIFAFGLVTFCRRQPRPWLALAVAIPYLVIVVGMGYSRQGIALALAMVGLVAIRNGSALKFVIWVALAATFHKSALLLLPIAALAAARNRYWTAAWVGLTAVVLYYLLLAADVDTLYTNYVVAQYQSEGAAVRLLMSALPAALLLIWRPRFQFAESEARLWTWFAVISLVLLGLLMATPASTALDRVALYMLPLQLVVFARLPDVFGAQGKRYQAPTAATILPDSGARRSRTGRDAPILVAMILLYYGAVQFVWLNYAANASSWLPYRFYPLDSSF